MNHTTITTVEKDLAALELRQARHQRLLQEHHERKHLARERHHRGWHKRKHAPINLI